MTTATYTAWRDFYAGRINDWLPLESLRQECARLAEVGAPSPELLLVHAMRELERVGGDMTHTKAENPMARYVSVYAPLPWMLGEARPPATVNWSSIGATEAAQARQFAAAILAAADEADRINAGGAT